MPPKNSKITFDPKRAPGYTEDMKIRRDLVLAIRDLRIASGLTQAQAAQRATTTAGTWSNMEVMRHVTTKLEVLMAAYRALGKRLVITVEDWEEGDGHADVEAPVDLQPGAAGAETGHADVPRSDPGEPVVQDL